MSSDVGDVAPAPRAFEHALQRLVKRKIASRVVLVALLGGASLAAWRYYSAEAARTSPAGARGPATAVAAAEVARGDFPVVVSGARHGDGHRDVGREAASLRALAEGAIYGGAGRSRPATFSPRSIRDPSSSRSRRRRASCRRMWRCCRTPSAISRVTKRSRNKMKDVVSGQQIDTQRALINQYKGTVAIDRALVDQARLESRLYAGSSRRSTAASACARSIRAIMCRPNDRQWHRRRDAAVADHGDLHPARRRLQTVLEEIPRRREARRSSPTITSGPMNSRAAVSMPSTIRSTRRPAR